MGYSEKRQSSSIQHFTQPGLRLLFPLSRCLVMLGCLPILCDKAGPITRLWRFLTSSGIPSYRIVFQTAIVQGSFLGRMAKGSITLIANYETCGPLIERPSGIASAATDRKTLNYFPRVKDQVSF